MKIAHDGVEYEFDMDSLQAHELRVIEQYTGMTFPEWTEGLKRGKTDALVAVVFTVQRRAGIDVEWSDLDGLVVLDLLKAFMAANGMDVEAIERGDVSMEALARGEIPMLPAALNRADRRAEVKSGATKNGTAPKPRAPRRVAAK